MSRTRRQTLKRERANGGSVSRRAFLRGSLATGLAVGGFAGAGVGAAPSVAQAQSETGADASSLERRNQELVTVLDLSKCVGCEACVYACKEANAQKFPEPEKPFPKMFPPRVKVEDFSEDRENVTRLTPYTWLYIQTAEVEHGGEVHELNIPRRCLHCENPPCANLCPWGAARKEDTGIVRIHDEFCLGGAKCRAVCPWHIPQRQTGVGLYLDLLPSLAGNGVMYKCDRCHDRVAQGELPACVEACPYDVQTIGPRVEMETLARQLAEAMDGHLYGLTENGGTNTIYVSPVPFEKLNAALTASGATKGQGKPHLGPVADAMGDENYLAAAVATAPLAGIAAGVLTVVNAVRKQAGTAKKGGDDA